MSYAPNPTRSRSRTDGATARTAAAAGQSRGRGTNGASARGKTSPAKGGAAKTAPRGRPFDEARNWKEIGFLAAGIAAGAAIGAGVALLVTSETGPQRRAGIARRARLFGHDTEQRWEDLGFALKEAARSARDRFRHRHAAADETEVDD